jgi:hypothetical protein
MLFSAKSKFKNQNHISIGLKEIFKELREQDIA